MQTFVVPVTGGLLKRFGWRVDQAVSELARQILHNFLGITALLQRGQRFRRQLLTDLLRLRTVFANGLAGALRTQPGINSLVSCSTIDSACTAAALRCARLC